MRGRPSRRMPAGPAASPPAAHPLAPGGSAPVGPWAFTLIEVMVALAIFFLAVFAILDSTAQSLRAARRLQVNAPDISSLAADLVLTNRVEEGVVEGDFGDLYPDYVWTREIYQVATNGLFQVDFLIRSSARRMPYEARASILLWRPESASGVTGLRR